MAQLLPKASFGDGSNTEDKCHIHQDCDNRKTFFKRSNLHPGRPAQKQLPPTTKRRYKVASAMTIPAHPDTLGPHSGSNLHSSKLSDQLRGWNSGCPTASWVEANSFPPASLAVANCFPPIESFARASSWQTDSTPPRPPRTPSQVRIFCFHYCPSCSTLRLPVAIDCFRGPKSQHCLMGLLIQAWHHPLPTVVHHWVRDATTNSQWRWRTWFNSDSMSPTWLIFFFCWHFQRWRILLSLFFPLR